MDCFKQLSFSVIKLRYQKSLGCLIKFKFNSEQSHDTLTERRNYPFGIQLDPVQVFCDEKVSQKSNQYLIWQQIFKIEF